MVGRLVVIEGKQGGPKDKKEGSDSLGGVGREKKTSGLGSCSCHCSCCCPLQQQRMAVMPERKKAQRLLKIAKRAK